MYDQLQSIEDRYEELGELLSDPAVISDTKRFMELSKEEANTRETVEVYRRYKQVVEGISDAEELLSENLDAEMAEMAKEELSDLKKEKEVLEKLWEILNLNPEISSYLSLEYALGKIMDDILKIIMEPMEMK